MSTSLINFLSHLKNAQTARILVIEYFPNKNILPFLDISQDFGYIRGYRLISSSDSKTFHKLEILLKYKNHKPAITRIISFSKPSRRFFFKSRSLSFSSSSFSSSSKLSSFMQGIFIISTSQGLMSHFTAHKLNIGGEVICHVR